MTSILLADSEPIFLSSMARKLRVMGYTDLTLCSEAGRLCEMLEAREYDVAFVDLAMSLGALNGKAKGCKTAVGLVRGLRPAVHCVALAGGRDAERLGPAMAEGACGALVKPIHPDQLMEALVKALEWSDEATSVHGAKKSQSKGRCP